MYKSDYPLLFWSRKVWLLTWASVSCYIYYEEHHLAFHWIRLYFSWIFNLVIFVIQIMKIKTVKTKSSRQCWAHSNSLCFVNFRKRNWFMKISSENCTNVSPEVRSWLIKSRAAQRTSQRCKENQCCPYQWENESCQKSQWTFLWDLLSFDKFWLI